MEGRLKKLIDYLQDCSNIELVHISAFQLGELSRETPDLVLNSVCPLILHKNSEVSRNASLSLSEILKKSSFVCYDSPSPWKLSQILEEELLVKKSHKEEEGFLELWRSTLVNGDWEAKFRAAFGLLPLAKYGSLCQNCMEDLASRALHVLAYDQAADYSGDIPEYPLREITSEIIKYCFPVLNRSSLETILQRLMAELEPQGPLLVLKKCELYSSCLYSSVKDCLVKSEDVVTEACSTLLGFKEGPDQDLCDKVAQLLIECDDLAPCLKFAIKLFDNLISMGCEGRIDIQKLFPLFFHKLTEVRVALYHSLIKFLESTPYIQEILHLTVQGLLFEQSDEIIESCFLIFQKLASSEEAKAYFADIWQPICNFMKEIEPSDYSFVRVYGDMVDPRIAYTFTDYTFSEDAKKFVEYKFFRRVWHITKCARIMQTEILYQNTGYAYMLALLGGLCDSDLNDVLKNNTSKEIADYRIKTAACIRLLKLLEKGIVQIPDSVTPIIQVVVTSYNNETVAFYKEKIAKCAARYTKLLVNRNSNEKFLANMIKRDPNPFLKYVQVVHGADTFARFTLLHNVIQDLHSQPQLFCMLTANIPESLHEMYSEVFKSYIVSDISPLIGGLLNIVKQVPEVIPSLISKLISAISDESLLSLLMQCLQHCPVSLLPYCSCLITPVLSQLYASSSEKPKLAEIFGELLQLVMLSSSETVPEDLRPYQEEGLEFLGYLKSTFRLPRYVPTIPLSVKLREYQEEGVSWLLFLKRYGLGGMLCDEMGLGKTLQALCAIAETHQEHPNSQSLVVCPHVVIGHWIQETTKFFPSLSTTDKPKFKANSLMVLSYHGVKSKLSSILERDFLYIVLDEGHLIQNSATQTFKCIKKLKSKYRMIMTGTPIQNKVLELWPFFDFLMPGFLSTEKQFVSYYKKDLTPKKTTRTSINFTNEQRSLEKLNSLHKKVLPFILRRLKKDVSDIPDKIIQDYYVSLNPTQNALLDKFKEKNPGTLEEIDFLRKLGYHPCLIDSSIQKLTKFSPKLKALKELLVSCEIAEEAGSGHKALVFYQKKQMTKIMERMLKTEFPLTKYLKLEGVKSHKDRQQIIETFNQDSSVRLMLLKTKAGGLGLNLQAADVVIFIDHDWNPVVDCQAMDRAHRIGQKNVVNVYRLIARDTLEEEVLGLQSFKTKMAQILVNSENASMQSIDTTSILANFNVL